MAHEHLGWLDDPGYQDRADNLHTRAYRDLRIHLTDHGLTLHQARNLVGIWANHLAEQTGTIGAHRKPHGVRSPIEGLYLLALAPDAFKRGVSWAYESMAFGRYRPDFTLTHPDDDFTHYRQVVVELDGHDFHERTPDQATTDKSRDRWFARQGITVIRYTGREVWNDAIRCATESLDILESSHPIANEEL